MAAGKLTSRFGDGNSSVGGSWDRGPFGAATSGFSPGPRCCCFRRHHNINEIIITDQYQSMNGSYSIPFFMNSSQILLQLSLPFAIVVALALSH